MFAAASLFSLMGKRRSAGERGGSRLFHLERAHGIQDRDLGSAHVGEDRFPHVRDAERGEYEHEQLHAKGEHDVLIDDTHGLA